MFDKLKSIFIIEDETGKKTNKTEQEKAADSKAKTSREKTSSSPNVKATASTGKVSSKFMDVLLKAMEANNLDGFDYLEFKHSLKSLEKMPMDEQTRFQSAYAMAQTMGATPDHLVKTANHYIRVLLQEEEKFGHALSNQKTKQIGDKEQKIKQMEALIKEKNSRIEELKADIQKHTKEMEKMKTEISNATVKVESTKNDFHASFNHLVDQIKKDIENMKNYLK